MGQLSPEDFSTWYESNSQEIASIFNKEGRTNAAPQLANIITKLGATVVHMVDQTDKITIKETYFAMLSNEEISKESTQVAEEHLLVLKGKNFSYVSFELLMQVDKDGTVIDYTKRRIPQ
jgi:hypothetical protein